jgi:hypothetical protein
MDPGSDRRFMSIEHVSKRFEAQGRRFEAQRDVTLDLREREFFRLLGPSGWRCIRRRSAAGFSCRCISSAPCSARWR